MLLHAVKAAALLATIAVVAALIVWRRSRARAAEARRSAALRHRLTVRAKAGMHPCHPENIGDPTAEELTEHGPLYVQVSLLLADAGIPESEPDGAFDDDQ